MLVKFLPKGNMYFDYAALDETAEEREKPLMGVYDSPALCQPNV